jgi:hypothetical protein
MTSGARSARANSFDQLQMVKLGETNVIIYICKSGMVDDSLYGI